MSKIDQLRLAGQLPSPKGVALAIMELCQRDDATMAEVVKVVRTDPALSSRLLRLANAASQGSRAVASIEDGVTRLGMNTVRQLAMGFSLVDQHQAGPCKTFDYAGFWSHSLLMAVATQELAKVVRVGSPDELFSCGLLAQIGTLAMASAYPTEFADILERKLEGDALLAEEREQIEVDHVVLTKAVMDDCRIPLALSEPVSYHEAPDKSGFAAGSRPYQMVHLLFQARRMADLGMTPETERHQKIAELMRLGGKIGLDADSFGELFDRVVREWQEWGKLLKVPATQLPSFDAMAKAPAPRVEPESDKTRRRVLLVEDDAFIRNMLSTLLGQRQDCVVHAAKNGKEALALAVDVMPQIVITDWVMPEMDGIEFCRALRATEWGQSMYVIMLTGMDAEEKITEAFEVGVDDYVTKPIDQRALNARMRAALHYVRLLEAWEQDRTQLKQFAAELAVSNRRLEQAAMTDMLTGLPNRRAGMDDLTRAWSASQRTALPLSLLLIDIDYFKVINDSYGHAVGDIVLREVAKLVQGAGRNHDRPSRVGGEEFLLVCYNTSAAAALLVAERLRKAVKDLHIKIGNVEIQTSISVGVAERTSDMKKFGDMVACADKALYAAKNAGRDRVCLSDGALVERPAPPLAS